MTTTMKRRAHPLFVYAVEMATALAYAFTRPDIAEDCARYALGVAEELGRPDLAYQANELLSIVVTN